MKPAQRIAREFLIGSNGGVHLCAKGACDCIGALTDLIEKERAAAVTCFLHHERLARLAKPRIAAALEETRQATRRRA